MRSLRVVLCGALAIMTVPVAQAQGGGPATGFALWTRISGSDISGLTGLIGDAAGSPKFVVGYQGSGFSLGLGIRMNRLSETFKSTAPGGGESKETITAWQLGPSALINFWHSPDRMTRGNLVLEATYGKITFKDEFSFGGTSGESKASGKILGVRVGVGGDHFFGEHFGLGAEVGFEGTFISDFKDDDPMTTNSTDLSARKAYGALRVTVVL